MTFSFRSLCTTDCCIHIHNKNCNAFFVLDLGKHDEVRSLRDIADHKVPPVNPQLVSHAVCKFPYTSPQKLPQKENRGEIEASANYTSIRATQKSKIRTAMRHGARHVYSFHFAELEITGEDRRKAARFYLPLAALFLTF